MKDLIRVGTGVKLLDDGLEGGVPKGSWVVITGEPGTGKSILCMHYAYAGLMVGDPVIYVTTEAEFRDVVRQARQFNINFEEFNSYYLGDERPEKPPQLVVIDIFSLLKTAKQLSAEAEELERKRRYAALDIETLIAAVNEAYRVLGLVDERHKSPLKHVRLVVDSISAFWADKPAMARKYSYQFKIATHRENVTALLVSQYAMTTKSVTADSKVIVKTLNEVRVLPVGDLFLELKTSNGLVRTSNYEVVNVDGIYTPSLGDDLTIRWCGVYSLIRSRCDSPIYEVVLDGGGRLELTGDHALYIVKNGSVEPIETRMLRPGDLVVGSDGDLLKDLSNGLEVDVRPIRVVGINRIANAQQYVYDLSVDPYENYVVNGVVVHNSTFGFGLEHIADGILHLWMDNVEDVKEVRRYLIVKKMRITNHFRGTYRVEIVPNKGMVLTKM